MGKRVVEKELVQEDLGVTLRRQSQAARKGQDTSDRRRSPQELRGAAKVLPEYIAALTDAAHKASTRGEYEARVDIAPKDASPPLIALLTQWANLSGMNGEKGVVSGSSWNNPMPDKTIFVISW